MGHRRKRSAELREDGGTISYRPASGDPLGLGERGSLELDTEEALRRSIDGTHPDGALADPAVLSHLARGRRRDQRQAGL